jgi:LysM repeat protein
MRHRSPARFLAPLALVTCAVAVYAVVHSATSSSGDKGATGTTSTTPKGNAATSTTKRKSASQPKTYTVKAGDVLSAIAEKTGTSVTALQAANPDVDASALHPGQKLKLPR